MVSISIASLIYCSTALADWVYNSVSKYTPKIQTGEAEFYFIANDPTDKMLEHLELKKYPYYTNLNKFKTEAELFAEGFSFPEYIGRVYRGYNEAIIRSKGEIVVLINSDHFFSPDWLENLLKYYDSEKIVTSQLVEPKHSNFEIYKYAINGEFGNKPDSFDEKGFIDYSYRIRRTGVYKSGAYMPCLFNKSKAMYCGLYPEGNIAGDNYFAILKTGDEGFFENLGKTGVMHLTAMDSIVYHLKEGEKAEEVEKSTLVSKQKFCGELEDKNVFGHLLSHPFLNYRAGLMHSDNHRDIVNNLLIGIEKRRINPFWYLLKKKLSKIKLLRIAYKGCYSIYLRIIKDS